MSQLIFVTSKIIFNYHGAVPNFVSFAVVTDIPLKFPYKVKQRFMS